MESQDDQRQPEQPPPSTEVSPPAPKKRLRIEKLEERITPKAAAKSGPSGSAYSALGHSVLC